MATRTTQTTLHTLGVVLGIAVGSCAAWVIPDRGAALRISCTIGEIETEVNVDSESRGTDPRDLASNVERTFAAISGLPVTCRLGM